MFGIPDCYTERIARMPGEHTWAIFYMTGEHDEIEQQIQRWLRRFIKSIDVDLILKHVLFLYMEHRAIYNFRRENNMTGHEWDYELPVIGDSMEAAIYGAKQYISHNTPYDVLEEAAEIMEKLFKGQYTPFGAVDIPYPHGFEQVNPKRNPFFEVGMRPLFWGNYNDNGLGRYVPSRYYGIVDLETGYTFSPVSWKYCLYTNKEVYNLLLEVAGTVFEGDKKPDSILQEFELSRNSGVCEMTVWRAEEIYQPLINDGWQAILNGVNSYDKSEPLRYTFGFKNVKCNASLLMPEYTITIQTQHTIPFEDFRIKVLERVASNIEFSALEKSFRQIITALKNTRLADRDMLPLFCKYFDISSIPESENGKERIYQTLKSVDSLIKKSVAEYGKNAYALLQVIMNYLSDWCKHTPSSDWELGKWVQDFLVATSKPGFSMSGYIGGAYYDIASWYGMQ